MTTAQQRLQTILGDNTLIFGHRGAMAYAPMNTLPAFELAYEQGADGIELDVHRSSDGELVIVHDFTIDETTDGEGTVTEMSLAQLKEFDAGSWFSDNFKGVKIPTLDEVFEAVGKKLIINVEIKSIPPQDDGVEALIAQAIAHHGLESRVLVSSFNPFALKRFRKIAPDIPIGFLYNSDDIDSMMALMEDTPHEAHHPYHTTIDEAYMQWARENGYSVNTWTVNEVDEARRLHDLGVNTIITNTPDTFVKALRG